MNEELTKEHQIIVTLRQVLTTIIRELAPEPGMGHPLSQKTIEDVRQCLSLMSAREREITIELGMPSQHRPHYVDEPKKDKVVKLHGIGQNKKKTDE